jgi:hypothetical protein
MLKAIDMLLTGSPSGARMPPLRALVFVLMVAAFISLATIHFSKGESLPTPPHTVTVRP